MIVALCSDPILRAALRRTAHPEEDVFVDRRLAVRALDQGFPRAVVYVPEEGHPLVRRLSQMGGEIRAVAITQTSLREWEAERRSYEVPPPRVKHTAARLSALIAPNSGAPSWVDRTLADLSRAAGARLPVPFRTVSRRVMEFPFHYADLHGLSEVTGMSRGSTQGLLSQTGASLTVPLRALVPGVGGGAASVGPIHNHARSSSSAGVHDRRELLPYGQVCDWLYV